MPTIIPFRNDLTNQELEVVLEDNPFNLNFTYNERFDFWTMGLLTLEGVILIDGLRLQINFPFLFQYPEKGLPEGEFFCIDTTGKQLIPNRENMGVSVQLYYFTREEIEAL